MKQRKASVLRKTKETCIDLALNLDGKGKYKIDTSIPFLDHMLELFSKHSGIDLEVKAKGDTQIDDHHLVEDIGIVLGYALGKALGTKKGINSYGNFLLPMDESLAYVAVDLGGRPFLDYKVAFKAQSNAMFDFGLFEDFFQSVATNSRMNLHIQLLKGRNNHHIAESLFKGFAKAVMGAVSQDSKRFGIPSTKGKI
jgi:imidazoleglycerol-phosphate dehydratase